MLLGLLLSLMFQVGKGLHISIDLSSKNQKHVLALHNVARKKELFVHTPGASIRECTNTFCNNFRAMHSSRNLCQHTPLDTLFLWKILFMKLFLRKIA